MARWHFGLDSSAIREGVYTDLFRGQQLEFAVEFRLQSWDPASTGPDRPSERGAAQVAAVRVEANRHELIARVDAIGDGAWVLDCGLLAGCPGSPPAGLEVGQWIAGVAGLDLSPHPGELQRPGVPSLARMWFVERVHHRVEAVDLAFPELALPDVGLLGGPEEPGWEELAFTDAWGDDDGGAQYLVESLPVNH